MEKIEIPEDQIAPMDAVANHIHGLRIIFVNVFAVSNADHSWILIDAGLPFSEGAIRRWAEKQFPGPPQAIVLTHGHFDHVSAQQAELQGPPAYFTSDWDLARESVRRLAKLRPAVLAPGHGQPLAGVDVAESLETLAANFDRVAVPENQKTAAATKL